MKFVNVDEFIKKYGAEPADTFDLCNKLREMPAADVIPVPFIDKWLQEHYGMHFNPIARDWHETR